MTSTLYYGKETTVFKRILLVILTRKKSISSFSQQTINISESIVEANYKQVRLMKGSRIQ